MPHEEAFFLEQLDVIERAIGFACRRAFLTGADAEDFASYVKLKLIEDDYAVLRKFERRCSFASYISVIVQRLLLDYRVHLWGKWHASAEAKRLGEPAVAIESMMLRDGMTIAEALPSLRRRWPALTENTVEGILTRLPSRMMRPRAVDFELAYDVASADGIEETSSPAMRIDLAGRIAVIVRETMRSYSDQERLLLRFRFERGLSIAEISRLLAVEQKPLYRRLQRLLNDLRSRLRRCGIDADDVEEVIGSRGVGFDFGFEEETSIPCPSNHDGISSAGEDEAS